MGGAWVLSALGREKCIAEAATPVIATLRLVRTQRDAFRMNLGVDAHRCADTAMRLTATECKRPGRELVDRAGRAAKYPAKRGDEQQKARERIRQDGVRRMPAIDLAALLTNATQQSYSGWHHRVVVLSLGASI